MRTTQLTLAISVLALSLAGCTTEKVEAPPLAGPSTVGYSIDLQSNTNTLTQDGLSQARITITARDHMGQAMNGRPLRAEIRVDGVTQDFGSLSTKNPVTGSTLIYTAPPPSQLQQRAQTVAIGVMPVDSGVFGDEYRRFIELILVPQGVIAPQNPSLSPIFTVSPDPPRVMDVVTFSAALTTNGGTPCNTNCSYAWDFGDGNTATGQIVTHQYRSQGSFQVRLTVTDARGATANGFQTIAVGAGAPFTTVSFTTSPATPGVNQDIFFNASATTAAPGRTIRSYEWTFGDGNRGSGSIVVHRYTAGGNYQVQMTAIDDAGTVARSTVALQVGVTLGPEPVADLTATPGTPSANQPVAFNASASRPGTGATIVSYTFNWGDGSPEEVHTNALQTHVYTSGGTFVATVTVRDSLGRSASDQVTVTVTP